MCLQAVVAMDAGGSSSSSSSNPLMEDADGARGRKRKNHKDNVEASDDQLARAPKGNLHHRLWRGDCLKELRHKHATKEDIDTVNSCEVAGNPAWERALVPRPTLPMVKRKATETFVWVVRPTVVPTSILPLRHVVP